MRHALTMAVLVFLGACKGGNDYASMAKEANAARVDAGAAEGGPMPPQATLLTSKQNAPRQLKLDGDNLVWLNEGGRPQGEPGIFKLPKGGGPTTAVVKQEELLAVASDGTNAFFLAPRQGKVSKVPLSGGTPEMLAETTGLMRALAIDDAFVYWAEADSIQRVPKAGGKVQLVVATGVPDMLTVDGPNVYWYSMISGVIQRAPKKGGAAAKVFAEDQHTLHDFFIDGSDIFYSFGAEHKMEIWRLPKAGGTPVKLIAGQEPANDFAVDDGFVYWITEDTLFKVPRAGGDAIKVVDKLEHGRDVAVDARFVYWTDRSGRVERMPR